MFLSGYPELVSDMYVGGGNDITTPSQPQSITASTSLFIALAKP